MPQTLIQTLRTPAAWPAWARESASLAGTIGATLLMVLILRTLLFQPFTIPSDSMEPTLLKGDYILVSKPSYGWSRWSVPLGPPLFRGRILGGAPRRGDIVVFKRPGAERGEDVVKRLIGLPGDRVQLIAGRLFLNGRPVERADRGPAADPDAPERQVRSVRETLPGGKRYTTLLESEDHYGETTGVYVVPKDTYFFLGDNRDNSLDSRWPREIGMGFVPAENLVGRVELIAASWRGGASLFQPWTWFTRFDPGRLMRRP